MSSQDALFIGSLTLDATIVRLGIALGLGLLVGLQRERSENTIAGLRTFALVTLLGGVSAILSIEFGGWILAAAFISAAAMVVMGNVVGLRAGIQDPGITTAIAVLLMFALGALVVLGPVELGIVLGGTVAVLLHAKERLQGLVVRLGDQDLTAIMRFVVLTLIILPVLPNQTFGPLEVLNPRQIWLMVVLIVGISLGGYLAYKFLGHRSGTALAGILGGIISSTATTVTYARRSRLRRDSARIAVVVVLIASAVVFVRLLVEIAVVAPTSLSTVAPPLVVLLLCFAGLSLVAWRRTRSTAVEMPDQENPTELGSALVFGGFYALILLLVAATRARFGNEGVYAIAAISGIANLDAITLSMAHLTREGEVTATLLWRVVTVAALSNLSFKLAIAALLGGREFFGRLLPFYAAGGSVAVLLLLLWPGS